MTREQRVFKARDMDSIAGKDWERGTQFDFDGTTYGVVFPYGDDVICWELINLDEYWDNAAGQWVGAYD